MTRNRGWERLARDVAMRYSAAVGASTPRKTLVLRVILALAVSAIALVWAFRGVDVGGLGESFGKTSLGVLCAYAVIQLVIHVMRVVRWGLLLTPLGPIGNRDIFAAASVGIFATFFLPLRLGELVRPAMAARHGVPFASAVGSVLVERIVDGLANLTLFFVVINVLPESVELSMGLQRLSWIATGLFGGALVTLIVVCLTRHVSLQLLDRLLRPFSPRLAQVVTGTLSTLVDGVVLLGSPLRLLWFLLLTAGYWGLNGATIYLLANGYADVPLVAAYFAMAVVVFAVMIPAGPAFAGTLEAGFRLGLQPFAIPLSTIAVIAIVVHTATLLLNIAVGAMGMLAAPKTDRSILRRTITGR